MEKSKILTGIITNWYDKKGYGFVKSEGKDYFIHVSSILDVDVEEGAEIQFILGTYNGRMVAIRVE